MQPPRRSVLTGQPLPSDSPPPPSEDARRAPSPHGPLILLAAAVGLLVIALLLVAVWRVQPGLLPFVPRTATPSPLPTTELTPSPPASPGITPSLPPNLSPGGKEVSQVLQTVQMITRRSGWGLGARSVWRSADGGQSWFEVTPVLAGPQAVQQAFFLDELHAWFLLPRPSAPALLYATRDGGQHWQSSTASFEEAQLFFLNPDDGMAWDSQTQVLYQSGDGGQQWAQLAVNFHSNQTPSGQSDGLSIADSRSGWLALYGPGANLFTSRDGGQGWYRQDLALLPGLRWAAQAALDAPRFFSTDDLTGVLPARAVSQDGQRDLMLFYLTSDGGHTWRSGMPVPAPASYSIADARSLFVLDTQSGLWRSADGGKTWQMGGSFKDQLGSGITLEPQGIDFVDAQRGWAWQTQAGRFELFTSEDGGDRWSRVDLASVDAATGVAAGQEPNRPLACRWQRAASAPLLLALDAGDPTGGSIYLNPQRGYSFQLPPGWQISEIEYACPLQVADVHRLVLTPPAAQGRALLTIGFRAPDQTVALRDPAVPDPTELQTQGEVDFFWRRIDRAVLPAESGQTTAPQAIYYANGQEIALGSEFVFTAFLESDPTGGLPGSLPPAVVQQAEQVLASLNVLRVDEALLARMNTQTSRFASPSGDWEVQVLSAQPLSNTGGDNYQRITVTQRDGSVHWTALAGWTRDSTGYHPPTLRWSPDERWLYVFQNRFNELCALFANNNDLRRLDLSSGQVQDVGLYPFNFVSNLSISPDASQVAYLPPDYLLNPRVVVRSLAAEEGANPQEQVIPFNDPQIAHWGAGDLLWSPDGQRLVFAIAGPFCADREEDRLAVLVDVARGQARPFTGQTSWLTVDSWLPDGRMVLRDPQRRLWSLDVAPDALAALPFNAPTLLSEAEATLNGFFTMLNNTYFDHGTYAWAAAHYGGSYADLLRLNPDLGAQDTAALMERACQVNGYYCLTVGRVTARAMIIRTGQPPQFQFTVELANSDGSLFALRERSSFDFTVSLPADGVYRVMNLPPR